MFHVKHWSSFRSEVLQQQPPARSVPRLPSTASLAPPGNIRTRRRHRAPTLSRQPRGAAQRALSGAPDQARAAVEVIEQECRPAGPLDFGARRRMHHTASNQLGKANIPLNEWRCFT